MELYRLFILNDVLKVATQLYRLNNRAINTRLDMMLNIVLEISQEIASLTVIRVLQPYNVAPHRRAQRVINNMSVKLYQTLNNGLLSISTITGRNQSLQLLTGRIMQLRVQNSYLVAKVKFYFGKKCHVCRLCLYDESVCSPT